MSREYRSPLREQRAARTREAVVAAAADCFSETGWSGTTMAVIAERAGVSVETVHATGPKRTLLVEAFRTRFVGRGGWRDITDDADTAATFDITDPAEALATTVDWVVRAQSASATLWSVLRAAALEDDEIAREFDHLVRAKAETGETTARWLLRTGVIEAEVAEDDVPRLAAVLNLVLSAETYVQLVRDHGFTEDQYRAWITRYLPLLRP